MLGALGIGAIGVIQSHIRQQRYLSYEREARHAYNRGVRGFKAKTSTVEKAEWESFPCFYLCVNCGFLSENNQENCPGCRLQKWIDLRNIDIAEQIREMENRERQLIPFHIRKQSLYVAVVLSVLVGGIVCGVGLLSQNSVQSSVVYGAATFIPSLILGWFLFTFLLNRNYFSRRRRYPGRWRLPVPLPKKSAAPIRTIEGVVKPHGELLKAPISGRSCIGYEVSVLFDVAGDKRPPMWVLEEERMEPFEIDGEIVEKDKATVEIPSSMVGNEEDVEQEKKIGRFLRQRGLFVSEGFYNVFEALIEPNNRYKVCFYDDPPVAARTIHASE